MERYLQIENGARSSVTKKFSVRSGVMQVNHKIIQDGVGWVKGLTISKVIAWGYLDGIPLSRPPVIDGDHLANSNLWELYRYHLDIPTVPRETLPMQDSVGGDNNRTPVKFQGADIYRIVGITSYGKSHFHTT